MFHFMLQFKRMSSHLVMSIANGIKKGNGTSSVEFSSPNKEIERRHKFSGGCNITRVLCVIHSILAFQIGNNMATACNNHCFLFRFLDWIRPDYKYICPSSTWNTLGTTIRKTGGTECCS